MKYLIDNVITIEQIDISKEVKVLWNEAVKAMTKVKKKIKKFGDTKFGGFLKDWKQNCIKIVKDNWPYFIIGGVVMALYGFGLLPITIFLFIV